MSEIIIAFIGLVGTVASGLISWLQAKKKYSAEVDNAVIDNMQKSLEFYKQLSDDNKSRLEEVLERNSQLEEEVRTLRKQVLDLTNKLYEMGEKVEKVTERKSKSTKK